MRSTVGPKGQVVIAKRFRERLGVAPGWVAVQRLVGDHVEIRFVPPLRERSLRGVLAPHIRRPVPPETWDAARAAAWEAAARARADRDREEQ